jgi:hypothetical protein
MGKIRKVSFYFVLASLILVSMSNTEIKPCEFAFKVYRGNNHIGQLTSSEMIEGNKSTYTLNYDVKIDVLLTIKIIENITSVFQDKKMLTSVQTRFVNGNAKVKNIVYWKDGIYTLKNKENESNYLKNSIYASISTLYIKEPVNMTAVYSESYQKLIALKKLPANKYSIVLPDGNSSTYSYKNGILVEVNSKTNWGNLRFVKE